MLNQSSLLRRVKLGIGVMLAVFAVQLFVNAPEYWPLTRWGMYSRVGIVPEEHVHYKIEAVDNAGSQHTLYGWELNFRGADVIYRAFDNNQIKTYAPLLVDIIQERLPDVEISYLSFWRTEWDVDGHALPPFELHNPRTETLLGHFPVDFYAVNEPADTSLDLFFGDTFGLLDFQIFGPQTIQPCESIFVHTAWQVLEQPATEYQITLVLADSEGIGRAQSDGPLADQLTNTWQPDDRYLDRRIIDIPCDFPSGDYSLLAGIYDLDTVENLPVTYPDGTAYGLLAYLTTFTVES